MVPRGMDAGRWFVVEESLLDYPTNEKLFLESCV